eukprot:g2200.t1
MGSASSVPTTRAEKWSVEDIFAAARVFFDKDEFVTKVHEADKVLQEEARALGAVVRLDGETLTTKLGEKDYKRLGFCQIGWPSWTSVIGQIREIHLEQDANKRARLAAEQAARAAERKQQREMARLEREKIEEQLRHNQRIRGAGRSDGGGGDGDGDARAEAQAGAGAGVGAAVGSAATLALVNSTDGGGDDGGGDDEDDEEEEELAPGDVPPADPSYDPRGWIDPETGLFVKRKRRPSIWWRTGKQALRSLSEYKEKAEVRRVAAETGDQCAAATYLDGAQTLQLDAEADPLYMCGCNLNGQLGLGDAAPRPQLTQCAPAFAKRRKVRFVACGNAHTVVATANWAAEVLTFGDNTLGQLGIGHTRSMATPQRVARLCGQRVTHLACGANHTLCATAGPVRAAGGSGQQGAVYAWGDDDHGELGLGKGQMSTQNSPLPIRTFEEEPFIIECGASHCAIVTTGDQLYTWGCNSHGQLGHGTIDDETRPRRLTCMCDKRIAEVRLGGAHTVLTTDMDEVWGWGDNQHDQLALGRDGRGRDHRVPVRVMRRALTAVQCGENFTLFATASEQDGVAATPELLGFGSNDSHQLGRGGRLTALRGRHIVQLAVGHRHVLALDAGGALFTWGANGSGQLGIGAASSSQAEPAALPQEVRGKPDPALRLATLCASHHTALYRPCEYERVPPRPATPTAEQAQEAAANAEEERRMVTQGLKEEDKKLQRLLRQRKLEEEKIRRARADASVQRAAPLYDRIPLQKSQAFLHLEAEVLPGMK